MNKEAIEKLRKCRQKNSAPISKDEAMAQILQNSSIVMEKSLLSRGKGINILYTAKTFSQRKVGEEQQLKDSPFSTLFSKGEFHISIGKGNAASLCLNSKIILP